MSSGFYMTPTSDAWQVIMLKVDKISVASKLKAY